MAEKIRIKSVLPKNTSSEDKKKVREAIDNLATVANNAAPEGTLLVSVYERKSSFTPIVKVAKDLMDVEYIYNFQSIQRDPSLLAEWTEILDHIKGIERIAGKRKKKRNESYRKNRERKEAPKEEKSNEEE